MDDNNNSDNNDLRILENIEQICIEAAAAEAASTSSAGLFWVLMFH